MKPTDNLKKERDKLKLSQEEVAKKLGVSRKTYENWETGKTEPKVFFIKLLIEFFKTTFDKLF